MKKALLIVGLLLTMPGNTPRPTLVSDVEQVEINPWGNSCGLRMVAVTYHGTTYGFDLSGRDSLYPPGWWAFLGPTVMRVGTYGDEVVAVGPDGSLWRLVPVADAALWCL